MFDKLGFPVEKNRYHYYLFFYKNILDTCLGYHKQLQIKKFDVISRIWGAILASPQVGKTNKTFLSTATSKKMPGQQKQQSAAPKMPPGCSNPFFYFLGLKCAEMRVYCKVNGLNKFVDKSDFFPSMMSPFDAPLLCWVYFRCKFNLQNVDVKKSQENQQA